MISIVESTCGTLVYMGNMKKSCPKCGEEIYYNRLIDMWISARTQRPLLVRHKINPTELKYFSAETPRPSQSVMLLLDNYSVIINYIWEGLPISMSNLLAWKPLK